MEDGEASACDDPDCADAPTGRTGNACRLGVGLDSPHQRRAPAVMADPAVPRASGPGGCDRLQYVDLCWPHLAAGRGHCSEL
jgi:hypothetical protein